MGKKIKKKEARGQILSHSGFDPCAYWQGITVDYGIKKNFARLSIRSKHFLQYLVSFHRVIQFFHCF